jgi:hypothetical protein
VGGCDRRAAYAFETKGVSLEKIDQKAALTRS